MKYKFFPHTADIIFEGYGKTLEKVFENSALALEEIMVDLESLDKKETYQLVLFSKDEESLLYDFLSELIFIKDTEGLLFKEFDIVILHKNKQYELIAKCEGDNINSDKQKLGDDAKAITLHEFSLKKEKGKWTSRVLVDI